MKVLVIGAGASWSTKDVENGVVDGLRANGVEVGRYTLDQRMAASKEYLSWIYRRVRKVEPTTPKPSGPDILVHALRDALPHALANQADWILLVSGMFVPLTMVEVFRRAGLPVAMLMTESPYDQEHELQWAAHADLVWTNERSSVPAFAAVNQASGYLAHAWRPTVHRPRGDDEDVPRHDVVFVGSCFDERAELLEAVDWTNIDFGLYGNWQRLRRTSPLRRHLRAEVIDNRKTAALYQRARIGLNIYRESKGWEKGAPRITHADSLNPRGYELAACGCFHLSSARAEVSELFGDLVPTFRTAQELESLIRQWLSDDAGREVVRLRLPSRVMGHTWTDRGAQMLSDLRAHLPTALERVASDVRARQAALCMEAA